jgi:hypothetical protein
MADSSLHDSDSPLHVVACRQRATLYISASGNGPSPSGFAARLSPLRGKAGLASQGTTGRIGRSTPHRRGRGSSWTGTTRAASSRQLP